MRRKILVLVFCWIIVIVPLACTWTRSYVEAQSQRAATEIDANQELADPVLSAINGYEEEQGYLPEQLSYLLPTYLSAIPKTVGGQDFEYYLDDINGYYLCFDVLSKPCLGCCYYGRLDFWDCSGGCE